MDKYYVYDHGQTTNDGDSWDTAFNNIHSAIDAIGNSGVIYVANNKVYNIDNDVSIDNKYVEIRGGFTEKLISNPESPEDIYINGFEFQLPKTIVTCGSSFDLISSDVLFTNIFALGDDDNSNTLINVDNDSHLNISNSDINYNNVINNSGLVDISSSNFVGDGDFIINNNSGIFNNVSVSQYFTGVINSHYIQINNSKFVDNDAFVILESSGNSAIVTNTLVYNHEDNNTAIFVDDSFNGNIIFINNTIDYDNSIDIEDGASGIFSIENNIILGDIHNPSDLNINAIYSVIHPEPSGIESNNNLYEDPEFVDKCGGNYNLLFGSPGTSIGDNVYDIENEINADVYGFRFNNTNIDPEDYHIFLYQDTKNNIVFSDYMKETLFGDFSSNFIQFPNFTFSYSRKSNVYNERTISAFSRNINAEDWTYDWDYVTIPTPEIKEVKYVVPRSIIPIDDMISQFFTIESHNVTVSNLKVSAFKNADTKGISFDYNNSSHRRWIVWSIDDMQLLTMRDFFTGTIIQQLPLLVQEKLENKKFITPGGLVPHGVSENGYRFIRESDPNQIIEAINEEGMCDWLYTGIDTTKKLNGLLVYKDNIFITYTDTTMDDDSKRCGLLVYPTKGYYKDYYNNTPKQLILPDIKNPSDLTVYEDGILYVCDNHVYDEGELKIKKYRLKYDYALKTSTNKNATKLLLRENYDRVSIYETEGD